MPNPQTRELARRLATLEKARLQSKQANLGYSTVDGGALQAQDDNGVLTMIVGQQFDGSNTAAVVTGPTPPTPTLPFVSQQGGSLRIYWDGTFANSLVAPMDFARVLAYAKPLAGYVGPEPLNQAIIVGQFVSATGGELTAALSPGVEYAVYLITWTQAGKYGPSSGVALGKPGVQSGTYRGTTPPWANGAAGHVDDIGDLWFDTSLQPGEIHNVVTKQVVSNVVTLTTDDVHGVTTGKSVSVVDVDPLLNGTRIVTAATSLTVSYAVTTPNQASGPVAPGGTLQGLNIVPANLPHIWDGATWVSSQDSGISDVETLANGTAVEVSTSQQDLAQTQAQLATLAITAADAYDTAYAADGRVVISDYEPTPADVAGKTDGSLWITRTRDRRNEALNPSFEVSTASWAANEAALVRQAATVAGVGAWAGRVANTASAVLPHHVTLTPNLVIEAGESLTLSGYLRSISGAVTGYYAFIEWYNSTAVLISTQTGPAINLLTGDDGWQRAYVTAQAPDATTSARVGFRSPDGHASAVWELDAVLAERSSRLGRYFDGGSEGGSWTGVAGLSIAALDGGAIIRLFNLEDGSWHEKFWTAGTISSIDASTIDRGEMNGGFIADGTIPVDKAYMPDLIASENLSAGALVNIWNNQGVPMIRLAKASASGYEASGFVLTAPLAGARATVYTAGYNPIMTNLTPGPQFLSIAPGRVASTSPQEVGTIVQRVGSAVSETTLDFAALTGVALT